MQILINGWLTRLKIGTATSEFKLAAFSENFNLCIYLAALQTNC